MLRLDEVIPMPEETKVLRQALGLSARERAMVAEKMLESLDELSPKEAERIWAGESEKRLGSYRAGRAKAIPAADVHRKARGLLR